MRQISRFHLGLIAFLLSISTALGGTAWSESMPVRVSSEPASAIEPANTDSVRPNHADSKLPVPIHQPDASVIAPEKPSPELERVVNDWKSKSANIRSVAGTYKKSEFNHIFEVEIVTTGRFFVETPHRWRFDESAGMLKKGEVSQKLSKNGDRYKLGTSAPCGLICTGETLIVLCDDEKTFSRYEIPQARRGSDKLRCPLPFRLLMDAGEFERKFKLSLFSETNEAAVLVATNRQEPKPMASFLKWDFVEFFDLSGDTYRKVAISLDNHGWMPTMVRYVDDAGQDSLYTFDKLVFNDAADRNGRDIFGEDVFGDTAVKGYKDLTPE